jgi:uroporphyrinogen-III synthase
MRAIVTRPEREARRWVDGLAARGIEACALPLIEIAPPADLRALHAAWRQLDRYAALMFVSANAVAHFLESRPAEVQHPSAADATEIRAWAPGPGTRQALLEAGWAPGAIDEPPADAGQFDSESLWQVVRPQARPGRHVLIVRGGDATGRAVGRDWLATRLAEAGAGVDFVAAYERRAPPLDAAQQALARQAAGDGSAWLFSSSEAIAHLLAALPAQDWSRARAVATHPRIAQAARSAGFGVVWESRPNLEEVVASIESAR